MVKYYLFLQENATVVAVSNQDRSEFTVPASSIRGKTFDCPLCAGKDSVNLVEQTLS
jgi:hypothetical protein